MIFVRKSTYDAVVRDRDAARALAEKLKHSNQFYDKLLLNRTNEIKSPRAAVAKHHTVRGEGGRFARKDVA